jgi:FAD/FMN-containing dehydrogenase
MWRDFMEVAVGPMGLARPFAALPALTVLAETTLPRERVEALLGDEMAAGRVRDALIAASGKDRARFWAYRESPYDYAKVLPPGMGFDVSFPIPLIDQAAAETRAGVLARFPEAVHVTFGHVADSNIHVNVALPGLDADRKHAIEEIVYGVVGRLGGSISAEHGIGRSKRAWLSLSRSPAELALMRRIKAALDPNGTLGAGRVL